MGYKMDGNEIFSYSIGLSEFLMCLIKCCIMVFFFKIILYIVFDGFWDIGKVIKVKNFIMFVM